MTKTPNSIERVTLTRMPDTVADCQAYIRELKQEIWRMDRRWAQLKASAQDADRMGHGIDTADFMRRLEQTSA